ncbi:MAG: transposase [bacterium]|nr:transposase [bacterium]
MYQYSDMSPQEREEIILIRKSRGYPLHAPPHPFRGEGYYFISAANYQHAFILNSNQRRTGFEMDLFNMLKEMNADLFGWVILPNHYHFLAKISDLNLLSQQLKLLHGRNSYIWNKEDGMTNKRKVWYHFSDRMIRNERHYYSTLNYIHHNPVKHHLCERADDWMWSSIHLYLKDFGREWVIKNWYNYKPGEKFGKGWDDL